METKGHLVDRVLNTLRQNSKDRWMSKRYILYILEEKMKFLLAQKIRDRSLYREENLYSQIECYEFEEIDRINCDIVEFRLCKSLMKGKKQLPESIFTRYGDSIRLITSLDTSTKFKKTTPTDFIRNKDRMHYRGDNFYYTRDNYPYLLNTSMEAGFIEILTLDTKTVEEIKCGGLKDKCKPSLEYLFIGSHKLKEVVVQETLKELMGGYMQIQPDENPDKNENSI